MFGQLLANKNKIATVGNSDSADPIWPSKHGLSFLWFGRSQILARGLMNLLAA
jgi:hypothetical protein